jgi:hypothetical protein
MRDPDLWQRIENNLGVAPVPVAVADDEQMEPLASRLSEDENWEPGYARGAVREYARFIYLSRVSPGRVTPSDIVDKVWHTHLVDSRSYVEEFCQTLFGQIVHHQPSGGPSEAARHKMQYADTLALYKEEFGTEPPVDYWYHYAPEQADADRRQLRGAKWKGLVAGIGLGATLHWLFGWVAFALFLGFIFAWIVEGFLSPRVPGPRMKSSDSDGGGGCGD